jgi:7-carboxy-7-deazaguanine synthase
VDRSVEQVMTEVLRYGAKHAVVTGGEPMIAPEIVELTKALRAAEYHITIETAGTVWAPVECDLMSISPKLSNSTPREREDGRWAAQHERLRYQPPVLARLIDAYPYQLKFVVSSESDLAEIEQIVSDLGAPASKVMLMPEGTSGDVVRQRGVWIAEVCKRLGYRFSPRLHIDLWGDRRGV